MSFSEWIIDRTSGQIMLYLTVSMTPSVDLHVIGYLVFWYLGIVLQ